jgi:hypothetical protein
MVVSSLSGARAPASAAPLPAAALPLPLLAFVVAAAAAAAAAAPATFTAADETDMADLNKEEGCFCALGCSVSSASLPADAFSGGALPCALAGDAFLPNMTDIEGLAVIHSATSQFYF